MSFIHNIIPINKQKVLIASALNLLKSCIETISKPLCLLFNKSLSLRTLNSRLLEISTCSPTIQERWSSVTSNYRPVSLLSCISKFFERIIFKHLNNFLYSNNLVYTYQAGFFARTFYCNVMYQLLETYHSVAKSIDDGNHCCMIFVWFVRSIW